MAALLVVTFLIFLSLSSADESAIAALRGAGCELCGSSLAVTKLAFEALNSSVNGSFTFLAPLNSEFLSLNSSTYINYLRFHLIPRRLSFSDLSEISLSSSPYLEPIAGEDHRLFVASSGANVSVDGVRVIVPDLFLQPKMAIQGLDGILVSASISMPENEECPAPSPKIEDSKKLSLTEFIFNSLERFVTPSDITEFVHPNIAYEGYTFSEIIMLVPYHVSPSPFRRSDLEQMDVGSRIPTFLFGRSIKVTENSSRLSLNGLRVTPGGDWESHVRVFKHTIPKPLDIDAYGPAPRVTTPDVAIQVFFLTFLYVKTITTILPIPLWLKTAVVAMIAVVLMWHQGSGYWDSVVEAWRCLNKAYRCLIKAWGWLSHKFRSFFST